MNVKDLDAFICGLIGGNYVERKEVIQELWGGYGILMRCFINGGISNSVIVKHINLSFVEQHPRGWATTNSHTRKLKSYKVESSFYKSYSAVLSENCKVPKCYGVRFGQDEIIIVLEDLCDIGFTEVKSIVDINDIKACLSWLSKFHATFLQAEPINLWEVGTYWHLQTRPDELRALQDIELKDAAHKIDGLLSSCNYKTILHGDAKLANFCFNNSNEKVAAVDFQYAGGGCGMKDVVYFIGSCLSEVDCERYEIILLNHYFKELETALNLLENKNSIDFVQLEEEWRSMY